MTGEGSGPIPSENRRTVKEFLIALLIMICLFPLVFFHLFFTQLPLIRIRFKGGMIQVVLLSVCFLIIFFIFFGSTFMSLILLMVFAPAILAAELLARKVPLNKFILFYIFFFLLMSIISNRMILQDQSTFPTGGGEETGTPESVLADKLLSSMFQEMDEGQKKKFFDFNSRIYPVSATIGVTIAVLLNVSILRKFKYYAPVPINRNWRFRNLKIPDYFLFVFLFFGLLLLLKISPGSGIVLNGFILAVFIYFLQGLAIFIYYLDLFKTDVVVRVLAYIALFLLSLWIILALVGLFDTWFNFRKYKNVNGKLQKE